MRKLLPIWANNRRPAFRQVWVVMALAVGAGLAQATEPPPAEPPSAGLPTEVFFDTSGRPVSPGKPFIVNQPVSPTENESRAVFAVRCWQGGHLIIDEAGWSAPQLATRFVALRRPQTSAPGLYLVDLQDTFCELRQR